MSYSAWLAFWKASLTLPPPAHPEYALVRHWQVHRQGSVARVRRGRRLLQNQTITESGILLDETGFGGFVTMPLRNLFHKDYS